MACLLYGMAGVTVTATLVAAPDPLVQGTPGHPAFESAWAEVDTIEGQANADGSLNVIQQAFQDHHGLQCGFCTPGMVMSAAALLKENPKPSEAEIRAYLEGNICRCTGYHNIVKAILAASGQDVAAIAAE